MITIPETYFCNRCGDYYPAPEMVFLHGRPHTLCLECNRRRVRKWKKRNPKKVTDITVKYGQRNKEKRRAVDRFRRAVKAGKFCYPLVCSECGKPGKIHAHHSDYTKPYQVIFLCPQCHSNKHSKRKTA